MRSRLQAPSKPFRPRGRSFDGKVLGSTAALLAALPFLVLYIDGPVKTFILSVQSPWGLVVATWVSAMGAGLLDAAMAATLMAIGLLTRRPREIGAGRLGLLAVITGSLSVQVLKHLFCRSRPLVAKAGQFFAEFPCLGKGSGVVSFPSGHSATAFALAYVLSRAYPKGACIFYGLASLVALSRIYLAKHFPSDVVAGAAIGLLAGSIVYRFAPRFAVHERI